MKSKLKLIMLSLVMVVVLGGGMFMLTACGDKKTFDTNTVTVKDTVVTYDGQAHAIEIEGDIPEWVTTSVTYTKQGGTDNVTPVNAGVYTATVTFKGEGDVALGEDKTATLTINKANFSNVQVEVKATATLLADNSEKEVTAKYDADDDEYYFDLDDTVKSRNIAFPKITADGKEYTTTSGATIAFYESINQNETFDDVDPVLEKKLMKCDLNADGSGIDDLEDPDVCYINYTISDENHNPYTDYVVVRVTRITHEIKTYEDLVAMKTTINELNEGRTNNPYETYPAIRRHRWVLRNDIDCKGATWTPIGTAYYLDTVSAHNGQHWATSPEDTDFVDGVFVGEFDGNGHTISNFEITNASYSQDALKAKNGINAGFFGYVASGKIHDVNFDNETIKIDTTDYTWQVTDGTANPVYAGFVIGRIGSEHSGTNLWNIKVTNSKMVIDAYKTMAGGIIGAELFNLNEGNLQRDNLDVENIEIYAINKSEVSQRIVAAGIVGDSQAAEGPDHAPNDTVITYNNCDVKNAKLGFDYAAYTAATDNKDDLVTKDAYEQVVAAFVGYARNTYITFKDCTIANYLIATKDATGYYGKADAGDSNHTSFENCTHTNDATWNGGVSGVYSKTGKTESVTWNGEVAAD